MIFIKKQLEIYTLSRPYKMGFMTSVSEQDRALSWFVSSCCKSSFLNMMSGQGKALLKCCQCCRNAHQQGSLSVNENLLCWRSAHMREIGFRTELGKFLLVEFGILGFPMRNTSQTLKNSESTNDWNPESKCYWQRLESSSWNPEFVTWNPESKFVLDSLRARFRTLVYFFFSPFPTPLRLRSKNPPPRVLFPYARSTISKEKIRGSVNRLQKLKLLFRCWLLY